MSFKSSFGAWENTGCAGLGFGILILIWRRSLAFDTPIFQIRVSSSLSMGVIVTLFWDFLLATWVFSRFVLYFFQDFVAFLENICKFFYFKEVLKLPYPLNYQLVLIFKQISNDCIGFFQDWIFFQDFFGFFSRFIWLFSSCTPCKNIADETLD